MLSTLGRAAIRKVGGSTQSTNRALQTVWQLNRVTPAQSSDKPSAHIQLSCLLNRAYATTAKAATKTKPRAKTTATKKTTGRKPQTKSKSRSKKVAKKPLKKKPVKKKPVVKKTLGRPKKKALTEEQQVRLQVKALKVKALLEAPTRKPATAWTVLQGQVAKERKGNAASSSIASSTKYKSLTPEELESYNHIANQNKQANDAAYKEWLESYTPYQIRIANNARLALKRKLALPKGSSKYPPIVDPRIPKRPMSPTALHLKARFASGDFKGIAIKDASPVISKEWAELSPSQRKQYEDQALADFKRYQVESKTVFGIDIPNKA